MKIFGVNEFAARFPNAIIGIITLLVIFRIGSLLFSKRFGFIWALAYFGSVLPFLYFKSGIIDPLFNLFIFLGIYYFLKFKWKSEDISFASLKKSKNLYLVISGLFIGLAILTKGPVAYLIVLLVFIVYWLFNRFKLFISIPKFVLFSVVAALVMFSWFGLETIKNGPGFMMDFITYQIRLFSTEDAGHGGFPGYHAVVLLIGCFPASIFAIRGFYKMKLAERCQQDFRKWMIILFWVVLILFSIVQSKIVHYSSLAYFPITFLGALTINNIIETKIKFDSWKKFGIISIGLLFAIVVIAAPLVGRNIEIIKPLLEKDPFALANLDADVNWTGWEVLPGIGLILTVVMFLILISKSRSMQAFRLLFVGNAVVVMLVLIFFFGRIEMYSQNAHVEFWKTIQGKEGYVETSGFKSYVHLFYSERQPPANPNYVDMDWLTHGKVDTDVYITTKIQKEEYWQGVPGFKKIGSKNGFVFFKRESD